MERIQKLLDNTKVQANHIMAIVHFVKVKSVNGGQRMQVNNLDLLDDSEFGVQGAPLIQQCFSSDLFASVERKTKTEIATILSRSFNRPFTVCFEKKDGEMRILRGRLIDSDPTLGYTDVEDLDKPIGDRYRQVDNRNIDWLIVDNVKYELKTPRKKKGE